LTGRTYTTPLLQAITHHQPETALLLLAAGANPNGHGELSASPLIQAAFAGQSGVVKALLAKGVDVDQEWRGERALSAAVINGHLETVSVLLAQGANLDFLVMQKWSLEEAAREQGHQAILALLIETGRKAEVDDHVAPAPKVKVATPDSGKEKTEHF
jgi:ankyrin repeat protein